MSEKVIEIEYDPYNNEFNFDISKDGGDTWDGLSETSEFLRFENQEYVFSNCVEEIVEIIDQYHNTHKNGLRISFIGTDKDFDTLEEVVKKVNEKNKGKRIIDISHDKEYKSADDAIKIIRSAYKEISREFKDYLPGTEKYEDDQECKEIGDLIHSFEDTISELVPICVVGMYSVGKSAFINALIGDEVLPSNIDPSTSRNVRIENLTGISITLEYKGETVFYNIRNGRIDSNRAASKRAEEFKKIICKHCGFSGKSSREILHDILRALNESVISFPEVEDVGFNVSITLPFNESLLNRENCKIVIIDTPGSNNSNIDQTEHLESLKKMMGEQTNALPIFIMDRNQVVSNDNSELKNLVDEYKEGFSCPNCLVVFSKAENISDNALNQAIPPAFLNWHGKTTFMYVCAVGAIGEKKRGDKWLDPEYQELYKKWKMNYDERSLPDHNIIPNGRVMDKNTRAEVSDALYATGIPSVEDEINYYIQRYANYKKCVRGKEMLLSALGLAKKQLSNQQEKLKNTRRKKEKEKDKKREELMNSLNKVELQLVNKENIIKKYQPILDQYCDTVLPEIQAIWEDAQKSEDSTKYIETHMQEHCRTGLFKKAYEGEEGIQKDIVSALYSYANDYKSNLQRIVKGKENSLSEDAQVELISVFNTISTPKFDDVKINGKMPFNLLAYIPFLKQKDRRIKIHANNICQQLRHHKARIFGEEKPGEFAERCINQPVDKYSQQLELWAEKQLDKIRETLDKDNSILSQYDKEIKKLEQTIDGLKTRLDKLEKVEGILKEVLDIQEKEGENE
ncbi:MAG: dynamin family protein [Lachnospiraceae bacterium]|nr:dynamin family protein [Lachnospiraceae bacterium]